jgi:hypothetical protein
MITTCAPSPANAFAANEADAAVSAGDDRDLARKHAHLFNS